MKYLLSIFALFAFSQNLSAATANRQPGRIGAGSKTVPTERGAAPRDVGLDRLIALDKEASSRVSSLSRLRRSTWHAASAESKRGADAEAAYESSVSRIIEGSGQLLALEHRINRALEDAYAAASTRLTVDNRVLLVRLAALHWHSQLRRHLQRSLHTSVPGLESDARCAGDLLADQMLLDYLRAVWGDSATSIQRAVDSLGRIAAQSACLGTEQSDHFASAAGGAFSDVEAFLRVQRLEWVIPSLAPLLAQPLLLFYDVEKYRGADGPLARWFGKYQQVLVESVRLQRSPLKWHGLWLYDRTTGRLVGFADRARPRDENEVRLDRFFTSLTSPENLGAGDCSLKEMVQRGLGDFGYVCGGATCKLDRELQTAFLDILNGTPGVREAALSKLDVLSAGGGLGRLPAEAVGQTCASGREQSPGGGGARCSAASTGGALSPFAGTLSCVSRQVIRPGTEVMSCLMEASGYCSDPAERLSKDLQNADLNGVPLGKECGLGDEADDDSESTSTRPLSPETMEELDKATKERKEAQRQADAQAERVKAAEKAAGAAEEALKEAKAAVEKARTELQKASQSSQPDQAKIKEARDNLFEATKKEIEAQTDKTGADFELKMATEAKEKADVALDLADLKLEILQEKALRELDPPPNEQASSRKIAPLNGASVVGNRTTVRGRCDPDNPECEQNRCTAMSESARRTMACVRKAAQGSQLPQFMARGLGCDPRNCDPEETTATNAPRGFNCLELMNPGASQGVVMKQCGLVHCAGGESTFVNSRGQCGCGAAPSPGGGARRSLANQCSEVTRCESGAAEYKNGSCVCRDATMPNVVLGPVSPNSIRIGSPPSYLNRNPIPPGPVQLDADRPRP